MQFEGDVVVVLVVLVLEHGNTTRSGELAVAGGGYAEQTHE
jgi:hypothetical protein